MEILDFSKREIRDIVISTAVLAIAFSGILRDVLLFRSVSIAAFLQALFILSFVFIFHELAHRTAARKFGAHAEYRMWKLGLGLALAGSLVGFIFAAPGAVYISPIVRKRFAWTVHKLTSREHGLIALSGPAINLAIGASFYAASMLVPGFSSLLFFAARISFFLALFNLIPFPPLDGQKIMKWDWKVWAIAMVASLAGYYLIS